MGMSNHTVGEGDMESLVLSSALLGVCIGTSLCSFWMAGHESALQDVFIGVASVAILLAGVLGSVTVHAWKVAMSETRPPVSKKHFYSAISKAKYLESIPESDAESLPHV